VRHVAELGKDLDFGIGEFRARQDRCRHQLVRVTNQQRPLLPPSQQGQLDLVAHRQGGHLLVEGELVLIAFGQLLDVFLLLFGWRGRGVGVQRRKFRPLLFGERDVLDPRFLHRQRRRGRRHRRAFAQKVVLDFLQPLAITRAQVGILAETGEDFGGFDEPDLVVDEEFGQGLRDDRGQAGEGPGVGVGIDDDLLNDQGVAPEAPGHLIDGERCDLPVLHQRRHLCRRVGVQTLFGGLPDFRIAILQERGLGFQQDFRRQRQTAAGGGELDHFWGGAGADGAQQWIGDGHVRVPRGPRCNPASLTATGSTPPPGRWCPSGG